MPTASLSRGSLEFLAHPRRGCRCCSSFPQRLPHCRSSELVSSSRAELVDPCCRCVLVGCRAHHQFVAGRSGASGVSVLSDPEMRHVRPAAGRVSASAIDAGACGFREQRWGAAAIVPGDRDDAASPVADGRLAFTSVAELAGPSLGWSGTRSRTRIPGGLHHWVRRSGRCASDWSAIRSLFAAVALLPRPAIPLIPSRGGEATDS
jgi:hypothetical protein